MSPKLNKRRLKKKEKAVQHNQKNELRHQRELEKIRISKQRELERLEKEIGERREHLKEERLRRRQMRKKEEKEFRQMREREELTRRNEEVKLQKRREKEERMRKKADEDRLKKETKKWKKEIRDEEKRRKREERERRREIKKEYERKERFRIAKKKLESKLKKIGKSGKRKPPFEVIKVGSNSNAKFTKYFDSYTIKINKYPIDPVNVFQKAIDITTNERGLVTGDKIRLIVSHPTWSKPFSTKLLTITNDRNFIYDLLKSLLEFVEYKNVPLNELLVEVQSTKVPRGTGRLRVDKNNIANKKSIICIKNTDTICLARSIVTAYANINKSKWTKSQVKNGFNGSRKLQEEEALKLHEEAGVEINDFGSALEDINTFAKHLGIQINIVDADYFNEIIYTSEGKSTDGKIIYLCKNKNHYDVITSMPGFLGKDYYCHTCKESYTHRDKHKCPKKCMSCFRYDSDCRGPEITCNNCNRTFQGQKYFDEHKRNRSKGDKPDIICNVIQKCLKCKRTITNLKAHVCSFSECSNCGEYCNLQDHKCYMKVVKTKGGHCTKFNTATTVNKKRTNAKSEEEIRLMLAVRSIGWDMDEIEDMVDWTKEEIEEILNCTDEEIKNMKNPSKFNIGCGNLSPKDRCLCCKTYTHNYMFYDFETQQNTGTHIANYVNVQDFDGSEWTFNTIDEFCNFVFQDKHKNYTFIAHNSKSFDAQFILKYCVENGIQPFCIYNGTKIMYMQIEDYKIRFIDSINFIQSRLADFPKTFGLTEMKKGYFPHFFNTPENQNYVGPIPDVKYYGAEQMMAGDRKKFLKWHQNKTNENYVFKFKKELEDYCRSDVDILRRSMLKFREDFITIANIDPLQ